MNEKSARITEPDKSPSPVQIETWIGKEGYRYWKLLILTVDGDEMVDDVKRLLAVKRRPTGVFSTEQ